MDEIIISNNIKVDLITCGINTPAMLPVLITIRIFGFNGDPVMNDRKTDIPLLIDYFIQQLTDQ